MLSRSSKGTATAAAEKVTAYKKENHILSKWNERRLLQERSTWKYESTSTMRQETLMGKNLYLYRRKLTYIEGHSAKRCWLTAKTWGFGTL